MDERALKDFASLSVLSPPLEGLPSEEGWVARTDVSPPDSPAAEGGGSKFHWAWDGAAMSGPREAFLGLNGFDEVKSLL
jgi:hypothetical protein